MKIINNHKYKNNFNSKSLINTYIQNNLREYIVITIIFVIGILIGVFFINNLDEIQFKEINSYINSFISSLKSEGNIDESVILQDALSKNITITIILWIMGSTVIGLLLVYIIICFKGFCLGYTISAFISILGLKNGIIFSLSTMLIQSVVSIPCIIALGVSGMKVYKSIMQDRRKENIKLEIIRHTLFSILILILLIASSFLESYISKNILIHFMKYI